MAEITTVDEKRIRIKLTLGALRRFEQRTGVKFFGLLHRQLKTEAKKGEPLKDAALRVFATIFEGIDEVASFLYECAVFEGEKPKFDEFCELLPLGILGEAFTLVMEEVMNFLPEPVEGEPGKSVKDPLGPSAGKTSTKPQGS